MSDRDRDNKSKALNNISGECSKDKEPIKRGYQPKESIDSPFPSVLILYKYTMQHFDF